MPTTVAVPGLAHVLKIFPDEGSIFPLIACIHKLLIVRASILFGVPLVEYVIVAVVEVTEIEAAVISLFAV